MRASTQHETPSEAEGAREEWLLVCKQLAANSKDFARSSGTPSRRDHQPGNTFFSSCFKLLKELPAYGTAVAKKPATAPSSPVDMTFDFSSSLASMVSEWKTELQLMLGSDPFLGEAEAARTAPKKPVDFQYRPAHFLREHVSTLLEQWNSNLKSSADGNSSKQLFSNNLDEALLISDNYLAAWLSHHEALEEKAETTTAWWLRTLQNIRQKTRSKRNLKTRQKALNDFLSEWFQDLNLKSDDVAKLTNLFNLHLIERPLYDLVCYQDPAHPNLTANLRRGRQEVVNTLYSRLHSKPKVFARDLSDVAASATQQTASTTGNGLLVIFRRWALKLRLWRRSVRTWWNNLSPVTPISLAQKFSVWLSSNPVNLPVATKDASPPIASLHTELAGAAQEGDADKSVLIRQYLWTACFQLFNNLYAHLQADTTITGSHREKTLDYLNTLEAILSALNSNNDGIHQTSEEQTTVVSLLSFVSAFCADEAARQLPSSERQRSLNLRVLKDHYAPSFDDWAGQCDDAEFFNRCSTLAKKLQRGSNEERQSPGLSLRGVRAILGLFSLSFPEQVSVNQGTPVPSESVNHLFQVKVQVLDDPQGPKNLDTGSPVPLDAPKPENHCQSLLLRECVDYLNNLADVVGTLSKDDHFDQNAGPLGFVTIWQSSIQELAQLLTNLDVTLFKARSDSLDHSKLGGLQRLLLQVFDENKYTQLRLAAIAAINDKTAHNNSLLTNFVEATPARSSANQLSSENPLAKTDLSTATSAQEVLRLLDAERLVLSSDSSGGSVRSGLLPSVAEAAALLPQVESALSVEGLERRASWSWSPRRTTEFPPPSLRRAQSCSSLATRSTSAFFSSSPSSTNATGELSPISHSESASDSPGHQPRTLNEIGSPKQRLRPPTPPVRSTGRASPVVLSGPGVTGDAALPASRTASG